MPNQFAYSRQFFDRYYRPDNVVLLVVGDVDARDGVRPRRAALRRLEGGRSASRRPRRAAAEEGEARRRSSWKGATLPMLLMGYHAPGVLDDERRPAGAGRARRAAVRRARAALQAAGDHGAEGGDARGLGRRARRSQPVHGLRADQEARGHRRTWRRPIDDEIARIAREGVDDKTLAEVVVAREVRLRRPALHAPTRPPTRRRRSSRSPAISASINAYFALYDKVTQRRRQARRRQKYFTAANRTVVTLKAGK